MEHKLKIIWEDTRLLTEEDRKHIEQCELCKKEYTIAKKIEESIENLPEFPLNIEVEKIISHVLLKPVYKIWQLITIGLLVICLPYLLQLQNFLLLNMNQLMIISLYSVTIYMFILIAFSYHFYIVYHSKMEKFSENVDIFLEKKLMKF
jgi:hypothetical protein